MYVYFKKINNTHILSAVLAHEENSNFLCSLIKNNFITLLLQIFKRVFGIDRKFKPVILYTYLLW
jgi:hypothetical protein